MAQLLNRASGALEEVPDDAADIAIASGEFVVPVEGRVPITSTTPDARVGTVPIESAPARVGQGLAVPSEEAAKQAFFEQEYGDRQGAAGGYGVLRGLSLGLSDAILPALDIASEEELRQTQAQNPGASLGGEIVGAVGGALIGGTPAGLASRAGARAGEAVGGRVLGSAVAGAVEGGLYGAGQGVTKVSLAEDPMSAEAAIAEIGSSALLGGVIGGVIGGGAGLFDEALQVGKRAAGRAAGELDDAASKVDDVAQLADDAIPAVPRPGDKARAALDSLDTPGVKPGQLADDAVRQAAPEDFGKFRTDYEQLDQYSAQMLRRAERKQYAADEGVQAAAAELRAARQGSNDLIPARRSYEVEAGGAQGRKAPYDWEKVDDAALGGIHARPDFEATLGAHEEALAKLKTAFGDKFEPFKVTRLPAKAAAPADDAVVAAAQGGGLPGLKSLDELPPEAAKAVKDTVAAKAAEGFGMKDLAAGVAGDWILDTLTGGAAGIGGMLGGVIGRRLLGRLTRGSFGALKGSVRESAAAATAKAAKVAETVLGKASKATSRAAPLAVLAGARFFEGEDSKPKNLQEAYKARSREIAMAQANPEGTRQRIHDSLAGFWAADPHLADKMEKLANDRVAFLASKMPKNPGVGSLLTKDRYAPSDQDVARWARYVEAAENPMSVLDSLADGTMTREGVETLQTLYPAMYSAVKLQILQQAPQLEAALPYDREVMLSAFMGVPVNSLMKPQSIAMLQSTFAPTEEEQPPPPAKPVSPPAPTYAQSRGGA